MFNKNAVVDRGATFRLLSSWALVVLALLLVWMVIGLAVIASFREITA